MLRIGAGLDRIGLLGAVVALACGGGDAAGPDIVWDLQPGVIEFFDEAIIIDLPETTTVGAETAITVGTFGGGCTAEGHTEISITGLSAIVQPFDSVIRPFPDLACTQELRVFEHQAVLQFAVTGVATVRVLGRHEPGGDEVEFVRTIVVQ